MITEQSKWTKSEGWGSTNPGSLGKETQLVILFGSTENIREMNQFDFIKEVYPNAFLWGGSTAGEIFQTQVTDDSLIMTAIKFEKTDLKSICIEIESMKNSFEIGSHLGKNIDHNGLVHLFVLSDGLLINGSELVAGITQNLPANVTVTGGLCGDGDKFNETYVVCNGISKKGVVSALGLYGNNIKISYGSLGGWDPFGPERLITKSDSNILYEFDNKSALELYKKYLGDHAKELPASGLLFPLSIRLSESGEGVVRTILGIDEENQSMIFAGDVPEGSYARLMKANFDRLIDGASGAAKACESLTAREPDLAILISCVGRKMVLKQRIEEEVEAVKDVLGNKTALCGFYSYGEISPFNPSAKCEFHNQSMTITTISEL